MRTKLVTGAEFVAGAGYTIKRFKAVNGLGATVKAEQIKSDVLSGSEDYAVGGDYANAGLSLLPSETHEGAFSKITVSAGTVVVWYIKDDENRSQRWNEIFI
jgi:hypothetical protein